MPRHALLWALVALLLLLPGACGPESATGDAPLRHLAELRGAMHHSLHCRHFCVAAARRAEDEGAREAARLLEAIASAQRVHEYLYRSALAAFGARAEVAVSQPLRLGSTEYNLRAAHRALEYRFAPAIATLLQSGNRYGARLMIRHAASENRMRSLIDRLLSRTEGSAMRHYALCPRCGYLTADPYRDPYCPQCLLSSNRFLEF